MKPLDVCVCAVWEGEEAGMHRLLSTCSAAGCVRSLMLCISQSVQSLSRVQLFATSWTAACQASLSITNPRSLLKLMSTELVMPSNHLILCHPLLLLPPIPPSSRVFFQWVSSSHEAAKLLEFQLQHQSFQWTPRTDLLWDGLFGSPCSPRGSQESSPTPQFKSINFSMLSFLYSPTLTSIYDYWKNHSLIHAVCKPLILVRCGSFPGFIVSLWSRCSFTHAKGSRSLGTF